MKRWIFLVLTVAVIFSLAGCADNTEPDIPRDTVSGTCASMESTDPSPSETETLEATDGNTNYDDYYAGKPAELLVTYQDYVYRYKGSDRLWESDVVFTVKTLLATHPALKDGYSHTKNKFGEFVWLNRNTYYNSELRCKLLSEAQALLDNIPVLEDYEIAMGLEHLVALLGDVHTWISTFPSAVLPISVEQVEKDGQVGLYVVGAPEQQTQLLFCRLIAINGHPVEDVIEGLLPYESAENEYGSIAEITELGLDSLLVNYDALSTIGVAEPEAESAVLTFVDHNGDEFNAELEVLPYADAYYSMINKDYYSNRIGLHARQYEENYWYEEWPEEHAVYFRIASCREMADYSMKACCQDILAALESAEEPMKLIIDLRQNGGGYYPLDGMVEFMAAVDELELESVSVLIDSRCYSATTYFAANFRKYISDAVFIGTPLGQPQGFFAGAQWFTLPKSNWILAISTVYTDRLPDLTGETFIPDILCYPNWEDYVSGVDTLIKTALQLQNEDLELP